MGRPCLFRNVKKYRNGTSDSDNPIRLLFAEIVLVTLNHKERTAEMDGSHDKSHRIYMVLKGH